MKTVITIFLFAIFSNSINPETQKIFIQSESPINSRLLIIEEDEHSVYVYIVREDRESIEFDGFLCSVTNPFDNNIDLEKYKESGYPPPLIEKYANEYSYVKNLKTEDISIKWSENLAEISIKGVKYLKMDLANKISYSKSLKTDCPYGKQLTE